MLVSDPQLDEAWIMDLHLLRARGVLRATSLPLWPGHDGRRPLHAAAKRDTVSHAASARDHLRLVSGLLERGTVARRWLGRRRRQRPEDSPVPAVRGPLRLVVAQALGASGDGVAEAGPAVEDPAG
jgi:hypothetical protein